MVACAGFAPNRRVPSCCCDGNFAAIELATRDVDMRRLSRWNGGGRSRSPTCFARVRRVTRGHGCTVRSVQQYPPRPAVPSLTKFRRAHCRTAARSCLLGCVVPRAVRSAG
jgi:hypothetical protein